MITVEDSEEFFKCLDVINGLTLCLSSWCNEDWIGGAGSFTQDLELTSLFFLFSIGGLVSIFSSSFDFVWHENEIG